MSALDGTLRRRRRHSIDNGALWFSPPAIELPAAVKEALTELPDRLESIINSLGNFEWNLSSQSLSPVAGNIFRFISGYWPDGLPAAFSFGFGEGDEDQQDGDGECGGEQDYSATDEGKESVILRLPNRSVDGGKVGSPVFQIDTGEDVPELDDLLFETAPLFLAAESRSRRAENLSDVFHHAPIRDCTSSLLVEPLTFPSQGKHSDEEGEGEGEAGVSEGKMSRSSMMIEMTQRSLSETARNAALRASMKQKAMRNHPLLLDEPLVVSTSMARERDRDGMRSRCASAAYYAQENGGGQALLPLDPLEVLQRTSTGMDASESASSNGAVGVGGGATAGAGGGSGGAGTGGGCVSRGSSRGGDGGASTTFVITPKGTSRSYAIQPYTESKEPLKMVYRGRWSARLQ